jgi:hypothetical protein
MLVFTSIIYPSKAITAANNLFGSWTWLSNTLGPTAIPMVFILALCIYNFVEMCRKRSEHEACIYEQRIEFHTTSAVMLGTLGTFIAIFQGAETNDMLSLLSHALTSSIVGMTAKLVFSYLIHYSLTKPKIVHEVKESGEVKAMESDNV